MVLKQYPRLHQQIIEIHRIRLTAPLRVPYIYMRHLRALLLSVVTGPGTLRISLRQYQMVLRHRDTVGHRRRLIHLIVEPHLLDDGLHQRTGIRLVVDGEIRVIAYMLGLGPQDTGEHAVEGTHLQIPRLLLAHQPAYALLHLTGSLVGKRQRENLPGLRSLLQQPGYLIRQHAGLSRSCSRNHQRRPVVIQHSLLLTLIQLL